MSTYRPYRCGISEYTAELSKSLKEKTEILANKPSKSTNPPQNVNYCWTRNSVCYPFQIFKTLAIKKPDIIHIQHEYGSWGSASHSGVFPLTLFLANFLRKPIILTMHTVIPVNKLTSKLFNRYGVIRGSTWIKKALAIAVTKLICLLSDRVIVHLNMAKKELVDNYGVNKAKVFVIPHGAKIYENPFNVDEAKVKLGFEQKIIVTIFGLLRPGKGAEYAVKAMPSVVEHCPNVLLLILGGSHPHLGGNAYVNGLKHMVNSLQLDNSVLILDDFLPEERLLTYFNVTDLFLLPYDEDSIVGASGALHLIMSLGKPIIATEVFRFYEDLHDEAAAHLIPCKDVDALVESMISSISNLMSLKKLANGLRAKAILRSWKAVAERTSALYEKVQLKKFLDQRFPR